MEEEVYYVNVREPRDTRRKILETSRQVVLALQKYENYKLRRIKKIDYMNSLRKNLKEINDLIARLKKELPQVKIKKRPTSNEAETKPVKKTVKKQASKGKGALDDLERELYDIESKLKELK